MFVNLRKQALQYFKQKGTVTYSLNDYGLLTEKLSFLEKK